MKQPVSLNLITSFTKFNRANIYFLIVLQVPNTYSFQREYMVSSPKSLTFLYWILWDENLTVLE